MSIKSHDTTSDQTNAGSFDEDSIAGDNSFDAFGEQPSFVPVAAPSMTSAPSSPMAAAASFEAPAIEVVSAVAGSSSSTSGSATVPTTSTTIKTTSASSTPSWMSTLQTASIAADMAAADVNGTVTYAGLDKLFTDLDTTLTSTNGKLTTAEFNDLKTIAANLNNGMSSSTYLTDITQALVNGNAANATWTGGGASSVTLGNLAAGATATQLGELVGKWFLGTDLPSSKVLVDGSNFSVSYSTSTKPLFASTGPSMNDVNQGDLGDCYLLSSLAEVASQESGIISSMFTTNGNNTYGVRFYVNGTAEYVTVNASLADGGSIFNSGSNIWASLAEKAYAQLQAGGVVTGNYLNDGNSFSTIGNGGAPEMALEEITGASAITDFDASGGSWAKVIYNSSFGLTGYTMNNSTASVLSILEGDLAQGDDLVLSSYTNASSGGKTTLVADHAMSIYGYDSSTGMLEIRNPWGTETGQSWDTTFEVSLSTLLADGDTITTDNVGQGKAPAPSAPVVAAQTAAQTWKMGQAVNFALAANTFTDPQGSKLTYAATLSNGNALPSWLSFNASTETFTGTVPVGTTGLSIKVSATDSYGLSASETFAVATPASAPVVAAQTAAQTWKMGQAVNFALAANTFTDPQGSKLTYAATLSNGTALPSWLSFNASTETFTGTVPLGTAGLSIKVSATDSYGLSTSETFAVATPAPSTPVVTAQTTAQTWTVGQTINFALAANTFTDPQGEALTYSATQSNGNALPIWLKFNSTTDTFTGTAPATATAMTLKVTATDAGGVAASETFGVTVQSKASSFLQAIASLTSGGSTTSSPSQSQSSSPQTLASPLA
jgi:NOL1/NOP2/fmu family ribosome biogenesis protein